jgi:hypothetical protein
MNLYRIEAKDSNGKVFAFRYAANGTEATKARREIAMGFGISKSDVSIDSIEMATSKPAIIEVLNELSEFATPIPQREG